MRNVLCISAVVVLFFAVISVGLGAQEKALSGDQIATSNGVLVIHPVNHATFLLQWKGKTIYVDPVGGGKLFAELPKADLEELKKLFGEESGGEIRVRDWYSER
jgi:hypothetical protein